MLADGVRAMGQVHASLPGESGDVFRCPKNAMWLSMEAKMKKLLIALGVMLLAGCADMSTSGMGSVGSSGSSGMSMGMSTGSSTGSPKWDNDPRPIIQREFNANDPYHGG